MLQKKRNDEIHNHTHHQHSVNCNKKSFQEIASETLKSVHFKITKARLAVISCLEKSEKPLSPKDIFEEIKKDKENKIDQVSVYRVLEALLKLGVIHQVFPSGDYFPCHTSCEKKPSHILLNCLKCHKISEIHLEGNFIDSIYEKIRDNMKFNPIEHTMQINGVCFHCQ